MNFFEDFKGYSSGNLIQGVFWGDKAIEKKIEKFWTFGGDREQKSW